jgi:hypothetical protein
MKIDHITYEGSRRGRTTAVRTSTSGKVRGFLSSPMPGNNMDNIEKRITAWPQPEKKIPAPAENFDITAFLTRERREEKAIQKQEKVISSTNSNGSYLPLKDVKHSTPEPTASLPRLHRKGKFSNIAKDWLTTQENGSEGSKLREKGSLADLKNCQAAMKTGKLERALARPVKRGEEGRLAPPRGPLFLQAPTARKSKPSSSKAVEYLGTSADVLDKTRREITSKFHPPFEHPNYSPSQRTSASSSTSSYSFYCQGESSERRLSGKGTDPWTQQHIEQDCRLCRRPDVEGIRGLCEDCEREFMRASGFASSDDEVKPIPPLKDRKTLSLRRDKSGKLVSHFDKPIQKGPRLATNGGSSKAIVITPMRQESQRAVVEDGGDADDVYITRWQRRVAKAEYERTQNPKERWSKYGNAHNFTVEAEHDLAPLLPNKGDGGPLKNHKRRTAFYSFWDDLLN